MPALALLFTVTVSGAAGCGTASAGGAAGTPVPPEGQFGWFAYGDPRTAADSGTPADAIERAGLRLPEHASVQGVETQGSTGFAESYLFVFRVDAATAAGFCTQDGLDGPRTVPVDRTTVNASMGDPPVTALSRWCEGESPTDLRWSRHVLIDAGDPATIHLLLQRTGG